MNNSYDHLIDTLMHKKYVLDACLKLIKYLYETDNETMAIELARRCGEHDNSKFSQEEMPLFSKLPLEKETMKNPQKEISQDVRDVIAIHWKNNSHHPEYYSSYKEMSELDIMEMTCDWYARSLQYDTNFLDFVETRQKTRFQFDDKFYERVLKYCKIISGQE